MFQSDRDSSRPPPSEVQFATKPKLQQLSKKEVGDKMIVGDKMLDDTFLSEWHLE